MNSNFVEIGGGAKGIDGLLVECCSKPLLLQSGGQITLCLQQGVNLLYLFHCHV